MNIRKKLDTIKVLIIYLENLKLENCFEVSLYQIEISR